MPNLVTKRCSKCRKLLAITEFPPDTRRNCGVQAQCRKCINAWMKEHYRRHPVEHMLRRAYARSVRKGMPFKLTAADITPLPVHCPMLGLRLRIGNGQQDPAAYSLDRIDNRKGYVRGNVVVVSYLANRLKNDGTAEQHERIAQWMRQMGAKR